MKTIAIVFSMFMLVSLSTNAQSKKVSKMMDSQKNRTEIYASIVNNHEFMQEFMQTMNGSEHATMMLQSNMHQNEGMMGSNENSGMMSGNMMGMMHNNMNRGMMSGSNKNDDTQSNMTKMMSQNPEMMKTCMKMMEGNMMGSNNAEDTNGPANNQEHLEHHK